MKYILRGFLVAVVVTSAFASVNHPTKIFCRVHQVDAYYQKTTGAYTPKCTDYYSHGSGFSEHILVTECS